MSSDKTFMDDRESLQALVECLPNTEREEYLSYGALMLESGFPNRKLVLYTIRAGLPTDIVMLTLGGLSMDTYTGPKIELTNSLNSTLFTIQMVPQRLLNRNVFLHVPQKFELKWKGKRSNSNSSPQVQFIPHYAVLIKTKSKPQMTIEGHTYCVRFNEFQERFPSVKARY